MPLVFAEWVDEVQEISLQLGCKFNHVLREANDVVDSLAREGAFS